MPTSTFIELTWDSNYTGAHRVAYRQGSSGPYTYVTVTCPGSGASCGYNIPITVDNESCTAVTYEGYIQATCEDISSLTGRVPFTTTFTPNPNCKQFEITCDNSSIKSVTLVSGGSGYASAPLINGVTALGSPVNIGASGGGNISMTGGSGTGLVINVGANEFTSSVILNSIVNPGSGYTVGNVVSGTVGVGTVYFTVTAVDGTVGSITLTNGGSGYTSGTTVNIVGANTTPASATVVLNHCDSFNLYDCDGMTATVIPYDTNLDGIFGGELFPGDSIKLCSDIVPAVPSSYTVTQTGACACGCKEYELEFVSGTGLVQGTYQPCLSSSARQSFSMSPTNTLTFCAVEDSIVYEPKTGDVFTVTVLGNCS